MKYFITMLFLGLVMTIPGSFIVYDYYLSVQFQRECGDYLKLTADANSIEIAKQRLDKALLYIETRQLTSGNTSILWVVPTNDLSEWYKNLKSAQNNLDNFPKNASETDISTALVKLRETLIDHEKEGDRVTVPSNLYCYPNQVLFAVLEVICGGAVLILGCAEVFMFMMWMDNLK